MAQMTLQEALNAIALELDGLGALIAGMNNAQFSGPHEDTGNIPTPYETNKLYLVGTEAPYDIYVTVDGGATLEKAGSTDIDLSDYYTKAQADGKFALKTAAPQVAVCKYNGVFAFNSVAEAQTATIPKGSVINYHGAAAEWSFIFDYRGQLGQILAGPGDEWIVGRVSPAQASTFKAADDVVFSTTIGGKITGIVPGKFTDQFVAAVRTRPQSNDIVIDKNGTVGVVINVYGDNLVDVMTISVAAQSNEYTPADKVVDTQEFANITPEDTTQEAINKAIDEGLGGKVNAATAASEIIVEWGA